VVIERGEGVRASKLEKLGWHASDTGEIAFVDVFVPDEHLLGDEGRGFYLIMANFQWERLLMALGAVGSMRAGLERAAPRIRGQAARHVYAWHATQAEAGAALTCQALRRFVAGADAGPTRS
jgi:acyl-CoA dehydrogenase